MVAIPFNALQRAWIWLGTFSRRHKVITVLLVLYLLWQVIFTPWKNPFAHDAVTIRGRFPFDRGFDLMFRQNAYGDAKWYRRWCGGAQTENAICRSGYEVLKPTRVDGQHYEITIYRDRYVSLFADWKEETWHLQYKADAGLNPAEMGATSYGDPENAVCDGGEVRLKVLKNEMFCMPIAEHKRYKSLVLTEEQSVGNRERLMNFWLYSELEAKLTKAE